MHEHLAVALVLAALGGAGAGQGEQLEVEVAVVPPPEAVDDAPHGTGADLGAEQVGPGEAGGRRRDGHADHVRGEVVGSGRERDGLHRRRRGRVVAGWLRPLAGRGVLCLVIVGRLPLSVGGRSRWGRDQALVDCFSLHCTVLVVHIVHFKSIKGSYKI